MQVVDGDLLFPPVKQKSKSIQTKTKQKRTCWKIHSASVIFWRKSEWLSFSLLLLLGIYAVGGFSANIIYLHSWRISFSPIHPTPSVLIIATLMIAQLLVFLGVIHSFSFLLIHRDRIGFILAYVFLLGGSVLVAGLVLFAIYVLSSEKALINEIFDYVKSKLSLVGYLISFYSFQQENKCCGVKDYNDWEVIGPPLGIPKSKIPESCCNSTLTGMNRTTCAVSPNRYPGETTIYTKGCGELLLKQYRSVYIRFLIESLIVCIVILSILILLYFIFYRWNKVRKPKEFVDPREQEDDIESDIIPGTPRKSYLSNTEEGVFYAP